MAKAKATKNSVAKMKPTAKSAAQMSVKVAEQAKPNGKVPIAPAKPTAKRTEKPATKKVPTSKSTDKRSKKIPKVIASFGTAPATVLSPAETAAAKPKPEWWENGVQFECQGSGKCCVSRGEYGFVYMTMKDRKRMAKVVGLPLAKFTEKYCAKTDGVHHLIDGAGPECVFLIDGKCSVYEGRPDQCRSWPFWPEVMSAKRWKTDVAMFCPGVGKGRIWGKEEIRKIIDEQSKSEYDLVTGN